MRRLLIISRSHNPLGGADRIIADLCRELPSHQWETILGLTKGARFDDPQGYLSVHQGLNAIEIDGTFGSREARLKSLIKCIRSVRPDIVLSMRVFDAYEAICQLKHRDLKTAPRLAVGVRALEPAYIYDVRLFRKNIDLCVTSGKLIAALCVTKGGLSEDRVESIGGGVAPPQKPVRPRQLAENNHTRPIRLLYAGRLEAPQKRALDLIPLIRQLLAEGLHFTLDICGAGPEEETLKKDLASLSQVTFHGWVDQHTLYEHFYPTADVFLHFAAWEGITISPREAMIHGCVPVISRFPGIQYEGHFINGVNCLQFAIGEISSACACIKKLACESGRLTELSANALASQTGRYTFTGAIEAWANALDHCLEKPKQFGDYPEIAEWISGRLSRLGVPARLQVWMRKLTRRPILHATPGSEWPTASGLMTVDASRHIMEEAQNLE